MAETKPKTSGTRPKTWMGTVPAECDCCGNKINDLFIDGKTQMGPWGIMCPPCHVLYGCGLGLGKGQKYKRTSDKPEHRNVFVKIEG